MSSYFSYIAIHRLQHLHVYIYILSSYSSMRIVGNVLLFYQLQMKTRGRFYNSSAFMLRSLVEENIKDSTLMYYLGQIFS